MLKLSNFSHLPTPVSICLKGILVFLDLVPVLWLMDHSKSWWSLSGTLPQLADKNSCNDRELFSLVFSPKIFLFYFRDFKPLTIWKNTPPNVWSKAQMSHSLIFPDVSCCVKDGGDIWREAWSFIYWTAGTSPFIRLKLPPWRMLVFLYKIKETLLFDGISV